MRDIALIITSTIGIMWIGAHVVYGALDLLARAVSN